MAEIGHHLFDDLLHAIKVAEGRIDLDDLVAENDGSSYKIRFNSSVVPVGDMLSYTLSKVNVKDISVKDADIEEIIRRLYKKEVEVDA